MSDVLVANLIGVGVTLFFAPVLVWLLNRCSIPLGTWIADPVACSVSFLGALIAVVFAFVLAAL